jgi:hypothetical protein
MTYPTLIKFAWAGSVSADTGEGVLGPPLASPS